MCRCNYLGVLSLYIIKISITVKSSRKFCYSREQQKWREWAENFINAKIIRILNQSIMRKFSHIYPAFDPPWGGQGPDHHKYRRR